MDYDSTNPDNTNSAELVASYGGATFSAYIKSAATFKCPSDPGCVQEPNGWFPRVRSYALNWYLGNYEPSAGPPIISRLSQIGVSSNPPWILGPDAQRWNQGVILVPPSQQHCFLDVHPDNTICANFGELGINFTPSHLVENPSNLHNGACAFSFADGHVEAHQWQTAPFLSRITGTNGDYPLPVSGNVDGAWFLAHTLHYGGSGN
jgi:prepilin-type processing-associated H-X9-DG protein